MAEKEGNDMNYPNPPVDIVSVAEVKGLANISTDQYDLIIQGMIPPACRGVEDFCKRRFLRNRWTQWVPWQDVLMTDSWPINSLILLGQAMDAVLITDSTNSYSFQVIQTNPQNLLAEPSFVVTSNQTLTSQTFLFATYTTLGALTTAVTAAIPAITFTYQPVASPVVYANVNTLCIRQGSGKTLTVGVDVNNIGIQHSVGNDYRISDDSDRIILTPNQALGRYPGWRQGTNFGAGFGNIDNLFGDWGPVNYNGDMLVIYDAGFDPSNVPQNLKMICACIVRDCLNISRLPAAGLTARLHVKNYDEYTFESAQVGKLINERYAPLLVPFMRFSV